MSGAQPQPHAQQQDESRQQQPQQTGASLPLPPQAKSPVTLPPHAQTPPPTAPGYAQAQPQPQPQPEPHSQAQPQPEPHRPPQAYPAPPVAPPMVGGAVPGQDDGHGHGHGHGQGQGTYGEQAAAGPGTAADSGSTAGGGVDTGTAILGRTPAPSAAGAAGTASAVRRPRTGARTVPQTRKARLRVAKADPWSVMKVSFLLSIALGVCTVVAVAVLWTVMNAMGVFTAVSETLGEATAGTGGGFAVESFLSLPRVLGFTTLIALIDVVLATALATLGAFIYNLSAGFVGGVELTLAEDE